MKWLPGRQGTGYRKLRLAQGKSWDLYLLDYPAETKLPVHKDPVDGKVHIRANFAIKTGGAFFACEEPLIRFWRLTVFRADRPHLVTKTKARRVVLSLGMAL